MAKALSSRGYDCGAFIGAFVLDGRWGLKQGFDHYDDDFDLNKYKQLDLGLVQRPSREVVDAAHEADSAPVDRARVAAGRSSAPRPGSGPPARR